MTTCIGCGATDDHPKDAVLLPDGTWVDWHMDCHARAGCPGCQHQTRNKGTARGDEFRTILETQDAKEA
jgi:hypothetical protein